MKKRFKCRYISSNGEVTVNTLEFSSKEDIHHYMNQHGFMLISYKPVSPILDELKTKFARPLNNKELIDFCNQMYFIFNSGTNLLDGLEIIKSDSGSKKLSTIINSLLLDVEQGNSLSVGMQNLDKMFPDLLIYMVKSGEETAELKDIFYQMKVYYEKQGKIKSKISGAMIQPAILLLMGTVGGLYFLQSVLPELMSNLELDYNQLPFITKSLISLSEFISNYYLFIIIGIGLLVGFTAFIWKVEKVRYIGHSLLLKIPVIGSTIRDLETYRVSMSLHLFVRSDVSLIKALSILENILKNLIAKQSIADARENLLEGGTLYQGFKKRDFFMGKFIKYIELGEQTGDLTEVFSTLSDYYKNQIDEVIEKSLKKLEPTLTVVMTFVIGIIVAAIALPIFSMVNYIQ